MAIHKGRKILVGGETYMWRFSGGKSRFVGSTAKTATLTVQHAGAHGALLRVLLTSRYWTLEMDLDDSLQEGHKTSFLPEDVKMAIETAMAKGWVPTEKGKEFKLRGAEFRDYVS